jgi:phosphoglycolate phosphatase
VLFPGTLEMLADLKARNHLLAVATGKSRRGPGRRAGRQSQLRGLFDATRTADETAGKPHPLMLQELMAELGVTPERTLMIGDTTHDLQMAQCRHRQRGRELRRARHRGLCRARAAGVAHSTRELHDWLLAHA